MGQGALRRGGRQRGPFNSSGRPHLFPGEVWPWDLSPALRGLVTIMWCQDTRHGPQGAPEGAFLFPLEFQAGGDEHAAITVITGNFAEGIPAALWAERSHVSLSTPPVTSIKVTGPEAQRGHRAGKIRCLGCESMQAGSQIQAFKLWVLLLPAKWPHLSPAWGRPWVSEPLPSPGTCEERML